MTVDFRLLLRSLLLATTLIVVCGQASAYEAPSGLRKLFGSSDSATLTVSQLPGEAQDTLKLIKQKGPFPYSRDGVVFSNREKRLPKQARGYYHEYTVKTPGARNRGARRIIAGNAGEYYYTDDHYDSFKQIKE